MRKQILFAAIMLIGCRLSAQNTIENVLSEIEKNNTTLAAIRKQVDAEKIRNKTGIYLSNPEAEYNYLWGSPSSIGNRKDVSIKQTIDFPTAYSYKSQIAGLRNEQAELEYAKQHRDILKEARQSCVELIHSNALLEELSKRLENATKLAQSYKTRFDAGETSVLEYNKAQVNLLNISKEVELAKIEQQEQLSKLTTLNGGQATELKSTAFPLVSVEPDFDKWFVQAEQQNPLLQWLKQEIAISRKDEKLNAALALPKLGAGYMSEKIVGEHFQGVTLGLSIPLWENKNTVKYAKARTFAAESTEADARIQFYNEMKTLHAKVVGLQKSVAEYRNSLQTLSNPELLQKALEKGEISLGEYLFERSIYYESANKLLEMERNMNHSLAELMSYL